MFQFSSIILISVLSIAAFAQFDASALPIEVNLLSSSSEEPPQLVDSLMIVQLSDDVSSSAASNVDFNSSLFSAVDLEVPIQPVNSTTFQSESVSYFINSNFSLNIDAINYNYSQALEKCNDPVPYQHFNESLCRQNVINEWKEADLAVLYDIIIATEASEALVISAKNITVKTEEAGDNSGAQNSLNASATEPVTQFAYDDQSNLTDDYYYSNNYSAYYQTNANTTDYAEVPDTAYTVQRCKRSISDLRKKKPSRNNGGILPSDNYNLDHNNYDYQRNCYNDQV
jgi:hypothetical protein